MMMPKISTSNLNLMPLGTAVPALKPEKPFSTVIGEYLYSSHHGNIDLEKYHQGFDPAAPLSQTSSYTSDLFMRGWLLYTSAKF